MTTSLKDVISIPNDIEIGGATYYQIHIKLPLRSFIVKKRYSDFEQFISNLCDNLGINVKDFPYSLPAKRINWLNNKNSIIEERKVELTKLLNNIIKDRSLQNEKIVLEFLQLPINFKFNNDIFKNDDNDGPSFLNMDVSTSDSWLQVYRSLKQDIQDCQYPLSIQEKIRIKQKINTTYQPILQNLLKSRSQLSLSNDEKQKRTSLINQLQTTLETILNSQLYQQSHASDNMPGGFRQAKRVLGATPPPPDLPKETKETKETLPLSNQELLQQQIQIHKQQDQEVEQLRHLIARQRNMGELIHNEVEEQNLMLDRFNEEVDSAGDKIKNARHRARKIV